MLPFSNFKGAIRGLAITTVLSLVAMPTTAGAADELRFLVLGDAPYGNRQSEILDDTIAPAIKNAESAFLIHVGDFKSSWEQCDTGGLIKERYGQLMALHQKAVFYTPGDNEWTDCDGSKQKPPVSELGRLEKLRNLIRSKPMILPAGWHYATQPDFPENARWTQGKVMFATVHIVGTNNGRQEILKDDIEKALAMVDERDNANRIWLQDAFDEARESNSDALVVATQADVTEISGNVPCSDSEPVICDAFAMFRDELLRLATKFKKPVLLIHGDTHPFCLDMKFGGDTAPKLWRLNVLGDYTGVDATAITVQYDDQEEPFKIKSLVTGALVNPECS